MGATTSTQYMQAPSERSADLVDSVCERISILEQRVTGFQRGLFAALSDANFNGTLERQSLTALNWLKIHAIAVETLMQVHHDELDTAGRCQQLFQLTSINDSINECCDLVVDFNQDNG